jgi:Tat protein translocase TatB subunit
VYASGAMFDIGFQEILLIGVLALLVFGPAKLPELGRMVGRAMREFRRASDEFRTTVETNLHINEPDPPPPTESVAAEAASTPPTTDSTWAGDPAPGIETPTVSDDTNTEPFCAQRGSKIFHRRDCAWVKRISEMDRVYFKVLADARDQGLQTCPVCEPWEPA